jgi:hypothetical protein
MERCLMRVATAAEVTYRKSPAIKNKTEVLKIYIMRVFVQRHKPDCK